MEKEKKKKPCKTCLYNEVENIEIEHGHYYCMTQRYFISFILKFNIYKIESLTNGVNMINFQDQVAFNYFFLDGEMNVKKLEHSCQ